MRIKLVENHICNIKDYDRYSDRISCDQVNCTLEVNCRECILRSGLHTYKSELEQFIIDDSQCLIAKENISLNDKYEDQDFQIMTFEYDSFHKLLDDFETKNHIKVNKATLPIIGSSIKPIGSIIEKRIKRDNIHAEYILRLNDRLTKVRFYKIRNI